MKYKLPDFFRQAFESVTDNIHVALPGKIETYDPATKKASVSIVIQKKFETGEVVNYPIIESVPVIFPGSSEALIAFPLQAGDGCLIVFSERCIEDWKLNGPGSPPPDPRKFAFSDAVCIPGLFSFSSPGKVGAGEGLEILYKDTKMNIGTDGLVDIMNAQADIYTVLKMIHDLLDNIVSTSNWIGNLGAPVQYLPYATDHVNISTLLSKINSLLKAH